MSFKVKKRKKATRYRGSMTHGRGFKKKARGSGHQGGKGMSGTGKRGDQKKTMILNLYGNDYFGKDKTLRRGHAVKKPEVINLNSLSESIASFVKSGKAKDNKGIYEINISEYKVLGDGELTIKANITAKSFSSSAKEKIEKAGGKAIILNAKKSE